MHVLVAVGGTGVEAAGQAPSPALQVAGLFGQAVPLPDCGVVTLNVLEQLELHVDQVPAQLVPLVVPLLPLGQAPSPALQVAGLFARTLR